jgi:Inner membrane protein YgaP-like, transmembrane domain
MEGLFRFLASSAGRVTRMAAGLVLILVGLWLVGGIAGWVIAVVGLVPLAAGLFDVCVFAPLFRLPFTGPSLRRHLDTKAGTRQ